MFEFRGRTWDPTRPTNSDHKQKHKKEHRHNRKNKSR